MRSPRNLASSRGISLPRENGFNNGQSSLSHDIADHMVQLHIHLVERFLHVVDVSRRHLDQAFPVPQERSNGAHFLRRTIRGFQQSH